MNEPKPHRLHVSPLRCEMCHGKRKTRPSTTTMFHQGVPIGFCAECAPIWDRYWETLARLTQSRKVN